MAAYTDEEYPSLLVILREHVTEEDLGPVVEGAFGSGMDLTAVESSEREVAALRDRMAEYGWTIR